MRHVTNQMRHAFYMHHESVFFTLWRVAQCTMPALCAASMTQCAAPLNLHNFASNLLPFSNTTFSCSIFLLWIQMSFLNMTNELYTRDFDFLFLKPTFIMFALWLNFSTLFLGSLLHFFLRWTEWFDFLFFSLQGMELLKLGKVTRVSIEVAYIWKNWNYIKFIHKNIKYSVFPQNKVLRRNQSLSEWSWKLLLLELYLNSPCTSWPSLNILRPYWWKP